MRVKDAAPMFILKTHGNQRIVEARDSSLRVGLFGVRIPMWKRFAASIQTGLEAHPASHIMGARSLPTG